MIELNLRPIMDLKEVKRLEYDVDVTQYVDGLPKKEINTMIINPIEIGNKIDFYKKGDSNPLITIPIKKIKELKIDKETKGFLKKENKLLELIFTDSLGRDSSIKFDVDDKLVTEIINQVDTLRNLETTSLKSYEFEYDVDGITKTGTILPRLPLLTEEEELLWVYPVYEGIFNKHIKAIEALTNFRALVYYYDTHKAGFVTMKVLDDVLVMNQHRISQSTGIGHYTGFGYGSRFGTGLRSSSGTSKTVGDVVFMSNGDRVLTFSQINDPHGVARLAKSVKKQLFSTKKTSKKTSVIARSDATGGTACSKCGTENPKGSGFCNKCGFTLQ